MYRVLLVDDEVLICQGLMKLIPWEEFGLTVAGMAHDGQEALALLQSQEIDILLLDISMPHMTGLELLARLREQGIGVHTIVISAYNSFAYVRAALKFGVENYLLKPVEREELSLTLTALVHKIDQERALDTLHKLNKDTLLDNLVYRYVTGRISASELVNHTQLMDLRLIWPHITLTLLKLYDQENGNPPLSVAEQMKLLLQGAGVPERTLYVGISPEGYLILLVCGEEPLGQEAWIKLLCRHLEGAQEMGLAFFGVTASCAGEPGSVEACYREVSRLLAYEFILPRNQIITQAVRQQDPHGENLELLPEYASLKRLLLSGDRDAFALELHSVFGRLRQTRQLSPSQIKSAIGQLMLTLFSEVDFARNPTLQRDRLVYDVLELPTIEEICARVLELADSLVFEQHKKRNTSRSIAAEMLEYVHSRYHDEVSLKLLAQHMHFHPAYLGQVFKGETGQMFSDYLCAYRIEQAKEFLRDPSLRIGEIAARVGIPNANYFSNTFNKLVGTYPSTYRLNLMEPPER